MNRQPPPRPRIAGTIHEHVLILEQGNLYLDATARIDSFCKLECAGGIHIGPYCHVASFCHLGIGGGELVMHEGSSCGSGCRIITGSNKYGPGHGCSAIAPDSVVERSFVHLMRNATIYAGVLVRPGVTIGEGATVAMGSVVLHDIPAGELWGGNPCRRLKAARGTEDDEDWHPAVIAPRDVWVEAINEFYGWPV